MSNMNEFYGEKEHRRLKDPPNPDTLSEAQEYISKFIEDGEDDDLSSLRTEEEKRKSKDSVANKRAHFLFSVEQSLEYLEGYATLDYEHIEDIIHLMHSIDDYIKDPARLQPINFMMRASPGEGKSHFIDCIATKLKGNLEAVAFNMSSMRDTDDLASALERARNVTVKGKIPLIFLDEFDTKDENYSLLLPLLWEGQIELGASRLKIGRAVIVLAGSTPILQKALDMAAGKKVDLGRNEKLPSKSIDLVSRINGGVIEIPSLNQPSRQVDKVCAAITLLRRKYGTKLKWVPAGLLGFIYSGEFNYGVRSIKHFIELIGNTKPGDKGERETLVDDNGVLDIVGLKHLFEDPKRIEQAGLVYHIEAKQVAIGIKKAWDDSVKHHPYNVPVWCEVFKVASRPTSWLEHRAGALSAHMVHELRGSSKDELLLDFSTWAGIEPYHITKLWLSEGIGEWNHGNEDMRHVFFNLRTLHKLLLEFINKEPDFLRGVGHRMGSGFGEDLVRFLPLKGEQLESIEIGIKNWCRFDVSGGWGSWDHKPKIFELHVRNNFLADRIPVPPTPEGKSPFCPIMEGYIQGVLQEIVKAVREVGTCKVTVEEQECGVADVKNKLCKFKYTIE